MDPQVELAVRRKLSYYWDGRAMTTRKLEEYPYNLLRMYVFEFY